MTEVSKTPWTDYPTFHKWDAVARPFVVRWMQAAPYPVRYRHQIREFATLVEAQAAYDRYFFAIEVEICQYDAKGRGTGRHLPRIASRKFRKLATYEQQWA